MYQSMSHECYRYLRYLNVEPILWTTAATAPRSFDVEKKESDLVRDIDDRSKLE